MQNSSTSHQSVVYSGRPVAKIRSRDGFIKEDVAKEYLGVSNKNKTV